MSPTEAAKILDLPADASPEQLEARFNELRRKLEDKIAKAPTPGLQAKYRESLAEITTAFETLTLAADSSSLPVATKQSAVDGGRKTVDGPAARTAAHSGHSDNQKSRIENRKSGREFAVVAILAAALLAAGGWFVMKTRAENAEQARLAAEAKAGAERKAEEARIAAENLKKADEAEKLRLAALEKTEQERIARQLAALKSRFAELNIGYEAVIRGETQAERELADLKSELRSPADMETRGRLEKKIAAQAAYLSWLRETLPAHPAGVHRARAASLLDSRSLGEAAAAIEAYAEATRQLRKDQAAALASRDRPAAPSASAPVRSVDLRILKRGKLDYPPSMLRQEREGLARISCLVQPDGKPTDLKIVEATTPEFGAAALKHVATFLFAPPTDADGNPVAAPYSVPVRFKLN